MKPLILSVVLCTYQGEAFLRQQLESLLAQVRLPDEIVVGDDASTDATWRILQAFSAEARSCGVRITLRRHATNVGYVENFSAMLREATGDILFLCDQDDVWHADKLAIMESRFVEEPDLLLLCGDARLVDADGKPIGRSLFDALNLTKVERTSVHAGRAFEDVLLSRTMVTGATAAMRRQLVALAMPVGNGWIHDEWLGIIAAAVGRMDFLEQPLIDYRQHGANQVGVPLRSRSMGDKWHDLVRPRDQALRKTTGRLEAVMSRLNSLDFPDSHERLSLIAEQHRHFAQRLEIGHLPHWRRVMPILREAGTGGYRRYGTGMRSMLRDLLRRG